MCGPVCTTGCLSRGLLHSGHGLVRDLLGSITKEVPAMVCFCCSKTFEMMLGPQCGSVLFWHMCSGINTVCVRTQTGSPVCFRRSRGAVDLQVSGLP